MAEAQQTVIIDGIVRGGAEEEEEEEEEEEFIFENLALYIEDETDSSIAYFDPDTEEVTVIASIEDLLAGISTAAGDDGKTCSGRPSTTIHCAVTERFQARPDNCQTRGKRQQIWRRIPLTIACQTTRHQPLRAG